ncbi:MAG TPA: hypothetical protein VLE99_03100 [Candidatus Saccharimonadales bacterium]|nr:hypothetical protein [Candidatus Saccharimonadales bacterium]
MSVALLPPRERLDSDQGEFDQVETPLPAAVVLATTRMAIGEAIEGVRPAIALAALEDAAAMLRGATTGLRDTTTAMPLLGFVNKNSPEREADRAAQQEVEEAHVASGKTFETMGTLPRRTRKLARLLLEAEDLQLAANRANEALDRTPWNPVARLDAGRMRRAAANAHDMARRATPRGLEALRRFEAKQARPIVNLDERDSRVMAAAGTAALELEAAETALGLVRTVVPDTRVEQHPEFEGVIAAKDVERGDQANPISLRQRVKNMLVGSRRTTRRREDGWYDQFYANLEATATADAHNHAGLSGLIILELMKQADRLTVPLHRAETVRRDHVATPIDHGVRHRIDGRGQPVVVTDADGESLQSGAAIDWQRPHRDRAGIRFATKRDGLGSDYHRLYGERHTNPAAKQRLQNASRAARLLLTIAPTSTYLQQNLPADTKIAA